MINTNDKSQTLFDFLEELIKYEQEKLNMIKEKPYLEMEKTDE
jgi:hypothetical protein